MNKIITLIIFCVIAISATACETSTKHLYPPPTQNDSIVSAALGDSIYSIIINAKSIKAEIIGYTDTIKDATPPVKLTKEQILIMKFLLCNPDNVASNDTVFGMFRPNAVYTFEYRKQILRLYFDYGLRKWKINDFEDKPLLTFDLDSNEFLRLSQSLFPNNEYFNKLIKKMNP